MSTSMTIKHPTTHTLYRYEKMIGKGGFASVHLMTDVVAKEKKVIKHVRLSATQAKEDAVREVAMLERAINHPNIIRYEDSWFDTEDSFLILMEYAPNGTLQDVIDDAQKKNIRLAEFVVKNYTEQLLSALSYCHDVIRVLHRDIKPANVLIDKFGALKLADFGIARGILDENELCETRAGTPVYLAPEMITMETGYTCKVDIWMMGCVLYQLMALTHWFVLSSNKELPKSSAALYVMITSLNVSTIELRQVYSRKMCKLVHWMLEKDPLQRTTATKALELFAMRDLPEDTAALYKTVRAVSRIQARVRAVKALHRPMVATTAKEEDEVTKNDTGVPSETRSTASTPVPSMLPMNKIIACQTMLLQDGAKVEQQPMQRGSILLPPICANAVTFTDEQMVAMDTIRRLLNDTMKRKSNNYQTRAVQDPPVLPPRNTPAKKSDMSKVDVSPRLAELAMPKIRIASKIATPARRAPRTPTAALAPPRRPAPSLPFSRHPMPPPTRPAPRAAWL